VDDGDRDRTMSDAQTGFVSGAAGWAVDDAPTGRLDLASVSDRCVACGSPLSSDQRYCVHCGERRSKPRFSLAQAPDGRADPAPAGATTPPRRSRSSAGATLVAGVGTLLLAMGVGVLIGHDTSNRAAPASSTQPVHITLQGGGGSSGIASQTTAAADAGGKKRSGSGSAKKAAAASAKSKAGAKSAAAANSAAASAATKVLGGKNVAPPTVTVGAKGHGPGYQNGHFTGNFFGN
jgi:hypothetical protein